MMQSVDIVRLGVHDNLFAGNWTPNQIDYYQILSVQDPDNFVVAPHASREWMEGMQQTYNNSHEGLKMRTTHVFKNHLYAYRDHTTNQWHRVRVDRTNLWHGTATVHLIDEGEEREVHICDLLDLGNTFWCITPLVVKAKLEGVFPPGELSTWPTQSVEKFKELCKPGDTFCGVSRHTEGHQISLVLFSDYPRTNSSTGEVSLQMSLVELGLAQASERFEGCKDYEDFPTIAFQHAKSGFLSFRKVC